MSRFGVDTDHRLESLKLSPRLIDVLALLVQGRSNKAIARELNLSVETVKPYVSEILRRLSLKSRAQVPMSVHSLHETLLTWDSARRNNLQSVNGNKGPERRNGVYSWTGQERRRTPRQGA
jgi:DNA-binding CsgD family transcriptional regulator